MTTSERLRSLHKLQWEGQRIAAEYHAADTIDALVAALVEMKATYGVDGRGYPRSTAAIKQADAALALARGGK